MQAYIYYAPTKLYIGNEEEHVGQIIKDLGYKNILFIYEVRVLAVLKLFSKDIEDRE